MEKMEKRVNKDLMEQKVNVEKQDNPGIWDRKVNQD